MGRPIYVLEQEVGPPARSLSEASGRVSHSELGERSLILCYHVNKNVPVIRNLSN
jgi:hypothetical protein